MTPHLPRSIAGACLAAIVPALVVLYPEWRAGAEPAPIHRLVSVSTVFHATDAHELERRAAKLVARYLRVTSGQEVPVRPLTEGTDTSNAIGIGKVAIDLGLVSREDVEWCGREGFVITFRDETVAIAGPTPVSALYAAQTLIERQTSLRGEVSGTGKRAQVVPEHCRDRPFFEIRRLAPSPEHQYRFHGAPNPRNGADPELFRDSDLWYDHTAGYLVPKKLYFEDHPEYFALRKGKRTAGRDIGIHLCLSNPAVTHISIKRMDAWMRKNPDYRFFPVSSGDWSAFCQCHECHKLDPPGVPSISYDMCTRELHWVNGVARAMAQRHPDKLILCFAYAATRVPPPVIRPEKNVWISLAIWRTGYPFFFDHVMDQKPELLVEGEGIKLLDRWLAIVPDRLCFFIYPPNAYEPALLENTASRIRFLAKKGIRGISFRYGHPARGDFFDLFYRVYSRLLWDPEVDVYAEAEGFLKRQYGAGGKYLMGYFRLCRDRYRQTFRDKVPLDDHLYPAGWYSEAFTNEALAAFDAAAAANADAADLRDAVRSKQYHFLRHVLFHLPRAESGEVDRKRVVDILERLSKLAVALKNVRQFLRLARAESGSLDKHVPGCKKMVVDWINRWHKQWMREMLNTPDAKGEDELLDALEEAP